MSEPLPTRRSEDWRYADLVALEALWPLPEAERLTVAADAPFARTIVQDKGGVSRLELELEAGASAAVHVLNIATEYSRIGLDVTLREGASFTLHGAQLGVDDQTLEIVTTVTHAGPNATSRQMVRSVLGGKATGTCLGKVIVARGADGTDADQSVRAMLLDRTATANARPELQIDADDVKCAHGCAVGELDASALFYLQSRGLPPTEARRLMLQAFIAEVFVGVQDEEALLARALDTLEGIPC